MGMNVSIEGSNPSFSVPPGDRARSPVRCTGRGGVAERSNAAVSKTVSGFWVRRGFKSLPLRSITRRRALVDVNRSGWAGKGNEVAVEVAGAPAYEKLQIPGTRVLQAPGGSVGPHAT